MTEKDRAEVLEPIADVLRQEGYTVIPPNYDYTRRKGQELNTTWDLDLSTRAFKMLTRWIEDYVLYVSRRGVPVVRELFPKGIPIEIIVRFWKGSFMEDSMTLRHRNRGVPFPPPFDAVRGVGEHTYEEVKTELIEKGLIEP